jgi:hypothetical protein
MSKTDNRHFSIVAHDAGAASQIFAWLKSGLLNIDNCKFCLEGPAVKLFKIENPKIKLFSLEVALKNSKILLSGTGWSSSLEHRARMLAKKNNIVSIAVIDHWLNYRERFVRDNLEVLPDIIWVSDKYAHVEARRCFPKLKIVRQRNDYLKFEIDEVLKYKIFNKKNITNILYVLEPVRDAWAGDNLAGEFQALNFFVNSIPSLNFGDNISIILKPHPSEPLDKYDDWLNSLSLSNIYIEKKKNLASLLAWSHVVVGCETYAMVVALAAHKRVISSLPKNAHICRLPYEKIERLNQN